MAAMGVTDHHAPEKKDSKSQRLNIVQYSSGNEKCSTFHISDEGFSALTLLIFKHNRIPVKRKYKNHNNNS